MAVIAPTLSVHLVVLSITLSLCLHYGTAQTFSFKEATLADIRLAMRQNQVTSRKLVQLYLQEISRLNPVLHGVIEVNPDAWYQADIADRERNTKAAASLPWLHGVPVLLKDNIGTNDKLNTTAGSFALLGSIVPADSGVVTKLRRAGAVILGKASLSEWSQFRSLTAPPGISARGGQGKNPYVLSATPCGSSSGSAISVAANLVAVALGTETDGSILCPASFNSVVGIKPTVGLTSRAGVIPITPRQDTVGPICRTVADAVHVLDAIAGLDFNDEATKSAAGYIPQGGYAQFLKPYGLKGKRIGIVRSPFLNFRNQPGLTAAFQIHLQTLRQQGATLVDYLKIADIDDILNATASGEAVATIAEFKIAINAYLKALATSPIRSLADIIAFNQKNADLERINEFPQDIFLAAEATNGIGSVERAALAKMASLTANGYEKVMKDYKLDALVSRNSDAGPALAIGAFPAITVPAGYNQEGVPFGITFSGLRFTEPKLIEIAYGFEQATKIRKPPSFRP